MPSREDIKKATAKLTAAQKESIAVGGTLDINQPLLGIADAEIEEGEPFQSRQLSLSDSSARDVLSPDGLVSG